MKLLELYSLATGLRIGKQSLNETFYPLGFDRYITVQAGSGMAAKNYPFYNEVLDLLAPSLKAVGIEVVQLGGKDDPPLQGCHHLQGQTTLHQSNYLLRHSLCHIGNDSWLSHRGGEVGVPLVISFGPTTPQNHGPYRFTEGKSVFIESHRFGRRATFASQEAPMTIAVIPPEQIANAALSLLGGQLTGTHPDQLYTGLAQVSRRSLYIGEAYSHTIFELVPNVVVNPALAPGAPFIIRMDYLHDEEKLAANLQLRKCVVVADREINLSILTQFKANLVQLRLDVTNLSAGWIKSVKRLGVPIQFFTNEADPAKVAALRLGLHGVCYLDQILPPTKDVFVKGAEVYLNKELDKDLKWDSVRFKTNKFLLSDDKVYLSKAHWQAGRPTPATSQNTDLIIDSPAFWEETPYHYYHLT